MRRLLLLPVLWLIAATPALALSSDPYLTPGAFDVIGLLAPPPPDGSQAQERDVDAVLDLQRHRTEAQAERAIADATVSIYRFADVLGPAFNAGNVKDVDVFFAKVRRETSLQTNRLKDCWQRPRPFVVSKDVHPPGRMASAVAMSPGTVNTAPHGSGSPCAPAEPLPAYSYSYPSGHSTFGVMTAILLAEMVPEKRAALFARGWEYGRNRVVGGVHFLSDVEGGRILATLLVARMMETPGFRADFEQAKTELRRALGLASER
jgi:acid phosphatase (class A)